MTKIRGRLWFLIGIAAMLAIGWFAFPAILYESIDQPIQFSHKIHTGENVGLACEDCHGYGEDGSFAGIPRIEKCAGCHSSPVGNSTEEKKLVDEFVTPAREIPWLVYASQPENVYFPHGIHVRTAKIACDTCHGPHGSTDGLRAYQVDRVSGYSRDIWGKSPVRWKSHPWEGMKMTDCSRCHARSGLQESCLACHK